MDRYADRDGLDLEDRSRDVRREIRLREHHDRLSAAFPRSRDVALESAQTEIVVEAGDLPGSSSLRRSVALPRLMRSAPPVIRALTPRAASAVSRR